MKTSAGTSSWAMTLAMVKVLPDPVTPSRVCQRSPLPAALTSSAMAAGWSPVGVERRDEIEQSHDRPQRPPAAASSRSSCPGRRPVRSCRTPLSVTVAAVTSLRRRLKWSRAPQ